MKEETKDERTCNALKMNASLLSTASNASNTASSMTKPLFTRDPNKAEHQIGSDTNYEDDLKYGIKVFINNNTLTTNNNNNNLTTTTGSNSIASDEDADDDDYEDVVDDNDSGIVTSTASVSVADPVEMSAGECQDPMMTTASDSDKNNNDNNDQDNGAAVTHGISSHGAGCESTPIPVTSRANLYISHNGRRKLRFAEGQDVLARWNDGLFYLGNILKIDEEMGKCLLRFEDNSEFWVMFKDIQRGAKEGEIMCCSCQGESSDIPDEIVLCDNCGLGYHQLCHNPPIDTSVLNPDVEWLCRLCVFASTVKRGGALKSGPNAQALQLMKQSLPYDMNMLTWDAQHKTNLEQSYCYCGGPGDWYLKMLQCCRCRMWFHEACIQCLDQPLLYGDKFYLFVCSFCNSGPEYLKRIQLKWVDIIQLALFDLSIRHQKKYYDLDKVLLPWIAMNHETVQLDSQLETRDQSELKEIILETLRSHKKRFQCGREIKKSCSLWGLRLRLPPSPPTFDLPIDGQITDEVMSNLQMKGRKTKTFVPVECQSPIRLKRKAIEMEDSLLKSKKRAVNGTKRAYGQRNRITYCNLDSIIPPLPNFEGLNHPFKTDLEQKLESEKKKLKENVLTLYQNGFDLNKHLPEELKALDRQLKSPPKQKGRRKAGSVKFEPPPPVMTMAATKLGTVNKIDTGVTPLSSTNCDPATMDKQLNSAINNEYLGVVNRLSKREMFHVLARRHIPEGHIQYLVQWEGTLS